MAKTISKLDKHELKQPDEFVSFWTRVGEQAQRFATQRKRALIVGLSMLATVIAGSLIFSAVTESQARKATAVLIHAERVANSPLRPDGAPATNPDGTPVSDDGIPRFKTEKERAEAALKEIDAFIAGPHAGLLAQAKLERGPLLLALGRADEAIANYEEILRGKLDDRLRFLAHEGLGYAQEAKGDLAAATATFAKLGDDAAGMDGFYKDRALYHQARIAELRGNAADAKKLYKEVLDKNPTTSLRGEITNRLAVLELK